MDKDILRAISIIKGLLVILEVKTGGQDKYFMEEIKRLSKIIKDNEERLRG